MYLVFNYNSKVISNAYKSALCHSDKLSIERVTNLSDLEIIKVNDYLKAVMSPVQTGCDQIKKIGKTYIMY